MIMRISVAIIGLILIGFIFWWFFGKRDVQAKAANVVSDNQKIAIEVKGGYSPEKIILQQGVPATLNFTRSDSSSCLDHVIFPDFGINQELPQGKAEQIKIDTSKPGEYSWQCGMNMFHGTLIVK
ncbi:cupredoxin domain-containing protein [Lactobacillus sp. ESL0681]|uniref:cupredoxin domain-containing protein n=1 Tax=Lactobacillus sp. ESL0681 TaxID=2983211 RepID=UPI0023F6BF85|nr:cupredoxin domain-containing protein [Lactobacillus sp. ESL0681]WEV41230.1 cupredoxin domain-containing protein [Lactobacillus sp. ESL0681]